MRVLVQNKYEDAGSILASPHQKGLGAGEARSNLRELRRHQLVERGVIYSAG